VAGGRGVSVASGGAVSVGEAAAGGTVSVGEGGLGSGVSVGGGRVAFGLMGASVSVGPLGVLVGVGVGLELPQPPTTRLRMTKMEIKGQVIRPETDLIRVIFTLCLQRDSVCRWCS